MLDASRAVQDYIDAQHNAGEINKNQTLDSATNQALGLPSGSTVEDMLHAKMDPLFEALLGEVDDHARIDSGIEVEDGSGSVIGTTRQSADGVVS